MTDTLISKIAAASIAVGALATDKRNTQQSYDYISADKILARAGAALAQAGVAVVPSISAEETVKIDYGQGKSRYDALVTFTMTVTDGAEKIDVAWRGRGSDYTVPDKALYKAITSGHKYFLAKLLNIGVGNEDGEHETQPETPQTPQERTNGRATSNHTTQRKNAARRPAAQPQANVDDAPEVDPDGPDNLFETVTPTDEELEILGAWRDTADAFAWAIEIGACDNEFEARNSLKNLINDEFDGKFTKANAGAVYVAYMRKQLKKLAERKEVA